MPKSSMLLEFDEEQTAIINELADKHKYDNDMVFIQEIINQFISLETKDKKTDKQLGLF